MPANCLAACHQSPQTSVTDAAAQGRQGGASAYAENCVGLKGALALAHLVDQRLRHLALRDTRHRRRQSVLHGHRGRFSHWLAAKRIHTSGIPLTLQLCITSKLAHGHSLPLIMHEDEDTQVDSCDPGEQIESMRQVQGVAAPARAWSAGPPGRRPPPSAAPCAGRRRRRTRGTVTPPARPSTAVQPRTI